MNRGQFNQNQGVVRVEYQGYLSDEILEAVRLRGGRISSVAPLEVTGQRSEELALTLAGMLSRSDVAVKGIFLRRSAGEILEAPNYVA